MKRLSILIAPLTILAWPQSASAEDFTFDVPVHVASMPRLTQGRVECVVSALPVGADGRFANENLIGRARQAITFGDRGYDGTVTVAFDNTSARPSTDARSYRCSLFGEVLNDSGHPVSLYADTWRYDYPPVAHVPIDREVTVVEANLP